MGTRVSLSLFLASIFFLSARNLGAGLCVPPGPKVESPYHYLLALADSLAWAKSARDRASRAPSSEEGPISQLTDMMLALKLAQRDYECAAVYVAPYKGSSNKAIRLSAQTTFHVFTLLVEHGDQVLQQYKKALDVREGSGSLGDYLEEIAELGARADDIWKTLPLGVIAATYAIVEAEPGSDKLSRLSLTTAERTDILKKLKDTFGSRVEKGMQAGQLALEASAGALYGFVSDTTWKSRDTR